MEMLKKLRSDALAIFQAGIRAVEPAIAVRQHLKLDGSALRAGENIFDLGKFSKVFVIGCGKASAVMAKTVEETLGDRITDGMVNVKYGHSEKLQKIRVNEAGHPVPDREGMQGTQHMIDFLQSADETTLVLCLISGGGSALLPMPADGVTLKDKQKLTERLLGCGASIDEINIVRKHISKVKGGQLARITFPATLITLILSDVVGDPLDAIASGPTVADPSTFADVKAIFEKYGIGDDIPESISSLIKKGIAGKIPETPKPDDDLFKNTYNILIGNNTQAVNAARDHAQSLGYNTLILSTLIEGETRDVARVHTAIAKEVRNSGNPVGQPACVLSGGETTVTLRGNGKGGRNQEFVLAAAIDLSGTENVVILSAGTDGTDGPTDAAGAVCDGATLARAGKRGLHAIKSLANNDAYPFFQKLGDLLITGPTKTNVMDLRMILVGKK